MQGLRDKTDRIMSLFEGYSKAYGTYDSEIPSDIKGGKLEIKKTARTLRQPVTRELWERHLEGKASLGIIPIRENNTCVWGVIDIDTYDISFADLIDQLQEHKLPLLPCRSKSGGVHLFLFMAEPVSAELMQARLKEMAALLGHGTAEIFPKQRTVSTDKGDLGSWLNMPYYEQETTTRYGIKPGGLAMSLGEFVSRAESLQQPMAYLAQTEFRKRPERDPDFGDGPPCMQHLAATGFPEGMRNKGMFSLATFAKKKFGINWVSALERWNRDHFDPPLPASEIVSIVKSQENKDYHYTCREHPLSAHCNSSLCRTRKFGVGGDDDYPVVSGMTVLDTEPPIWYLDVNGERLDFTTDELMQYRMFQKKCMETLKLCFRNMKQDDWMQIVRDAMKDHTKIDAPSEVGLSGQFYEVLENFVLNRHKGEMREDILLGRPWLDSDTRRHYFRLGDLQKYMVAEGFRDYSRGMIVTKIRHIGGDRGFFNIKGKGVNVWFVPDVYEEIPRLSLPPLSPDPI